MGIAIPQVVTSDRASGAQVIDGSLQFDSAKNQDVRRTPGSASNRRTWTWSSWVKRASTGSTYAMFGSGTGSNDLDAIDFNGERFRYTRSTSGSFKDVKTNALHRDLSAWYHVVCAVDTTQATSSNRVKLYVNGVQQTSLNAANYPSENEDTFFNSTEPQVIGKRSSHQTNSFDGRMSQAYFIDGQQLGPESFGRTDGLTNTWRPKKYEGTFGTNGFYLPFDGSASIGQDQSGQGNNYTPVNFGGSLELGNPNVSGARPILNVTQGGTQAGVGVFGSRENVGYAVTVYDDGGGNKYYIDGTKQATLTGLIRGATYTFNQTDSSNSTHPLVFGTTANGNDFSNGVSITGSPGSTGITSITIPYNAPNILYYHCSAHANMGDSITGITTNEKLVDQYASNCVLALPLVGSKDDVSVSVACTSATKAVTSTNAVASSAASNFYGGSWYFDGTGDYLTIPYAADTFSFGTGDFTIEAFVNMSAVAYTAIISSTNTSINATNHWLLGFSNTANMMSFKIDGSGASSVTSDFSGYYSKWTHVAVSRESGTIRLFFDGVLKASATDNSSLTGDSGNAVKIGQRYTNQDAYSINGYMQDLRVYNGVAKYTSDFVVPATSPDILPDTPSGVSGSSKLTKVTDGAVSFDGSGDYLSIADSSDLTVGTNPFTLEFYAYKTAAGEDFFCGSYDSSGTTASLSYAIQTGGSSPTNSLVAHVASGGSATSVNSGVDFVLNKWVHVAFVRDGNTLRLFQDGIQMSTAAFSATVNDASNAFEIGRAGFSGKDFPGFISNFRFVNGTALYTTDFTPPTRELTNVTNTKLLCCQSNTSATEGAVKPGTITSNGDAAATNFNPFNTDIKIVRGQETGYATLNPLDTVNSPILSNGNLDQSEDASEYGRSRSTLSFDVEDLNGYYAEIIATGSAASSTAFGIIPSDQKLDTGSTNGITGYKGLSGRATGWWTVDGATNGTTDTGLTETPGDVLALAARRGSVDMYINGVFVGTFSGLSGQYSFITSAYGASNSLSANFGQKPFKFPPPDGFQPLNAANLRPETVISRSDQFVGVTTYTSNNDTLSVSDYKFQPDLLLFKNRDTANHWGWFDSVRGANKQLSSNRTNAEITTSGSGYGTGTMNSFDSNGFTLGDDVGSNTTNYPSDDGHVVSGFKAGGNKNTFNVDDVGYASAAAAGLDGGAINPAGASVGTKQGFSIILQSGLTAYADSESSHGLSQTPDFIISKNKAAAGQWDVYHSGLTSDKRIRLNSSNEEFSPNFSNTDSSMKSVGSSTFTFVANSGSGNDIIHYIWHNVPGLQKFGSYAGVDSAANFVNLGFRPALLVIKFYDGTDVGSHAGWKVIDNQRNKFNISGIMQKVAWDVNEAENGGTTISTSEGKVDFLSNGFRILDNHSPFNTSGRNYIYMAWAEAPTFNLYGAQSNAR